MDPNKKSLAVAEDFKLGDRLSFCTRDENSARVDLTRMCAELREDLDAPAPKLNELQAAGFSGIHSQRKPRGAVYIACNGRGAALFGLQGVEQQIVREQLGDIPLIGFSANGEIFRGALYGYTGVLALFF
jgi:small ligand-binding sensory domain FIST